MLILFTEGSPLKTVFFLTHQAFLAKALAERLKGDYKCYHHDQGEFHYLLQDMHPFVMVLDERYDLSLFKQEWNQYEKGSIIYLGDQQKAEQLQINFSHILTLPCDIEELAKNIFELDHQGENNG